MTDPQKGAERQGDTRDAPADLQRHDPIADATHVLGKARGGRGGREYQGVVAKLAEPLIKVYDVLAHATGHLMVVRRHQCDPQAIGQKR